MLFFRMRDLQGIDSCLLKELKSSCAKESSFLPRATGLRIIESAAAEVGSLLTYFSILLVSAQAAAESDLDWCCAIFSAF